jgi:hypothetical protein
MLSARPYLTVSKMSLPPVCLKPLGLLLLISAAGVIAESACAWHPKKNFPDQVTPTPSGASEATPASRSGFPPGWPIQPFVSGHIPVAVLPHSSTQPPTNVRPYFDLFSWESFIALNWPAVPGQPGQAEQPNNQAFFKATPNGTVVVWTSYKTSDDLFGTGSLRPIPWSAESASTISGHPALRRLTKSSSLEKLTDENEAFSFPLVDQNSHYVRYEVRYNEPFYNFVRGTDQDPSSWLYLSKNLVPREPVTLPSSSSPDTPGAMMVKASWREMTPADIAGNRYYIIQAMVYDPTQKIYTLKNMGLVGLHIAQKVQSFPEWIWSTFEQVDNVQRGPGASAVTPISFNNGTTNPTTTGGWANRPAPLQPVADPSPVQVTRFNPIPNTPATASTQQINQAFQQLLNGTVWQYYELVITQWPVTPSRFQTMENGGVYPADCGGAFPATGCTNTTMETYFQAPNDAVGAGGNSCMSCHYRAGQADFSWGLMRRSH